MKSPLLSIRRLALAASALLALTLALPLGLAGVAAATTTTAAGDARPAWEDRTAPLTISPTSGGAGTSVTIRATCRPSRPAHSDAFQSDVQLQKANGEWVGTGRVRTTGLQIGRNYPVTVICEDGVTLSASFIYTAATPSGGASAGFGGSVETNSQVTALVIGGGVAVAGAGGYLFLARRRRTSGRYSY